MLPIEIPEGTTIESLVTDVVPSLHARMVGADAPGDVFTIAVRVEGRGGWTVRIRGREMKVEEGEAARPTLWMHTTERAVERFLEDALGPRRLLPKFAPVGGVTTMSDPRVVKRVAMASGRIELAVKDDDGERLADCLRVRRRRAQGNRSGGRGRRRRDAPRHARARPSRGARPGRRARRRGREGARQPLPRDAARARGGPVLPRETMRAWTLLVLLPAVPACRGHATPEDCRAMTEHYLDLAVKETPAAAAMSPAQTAAVRDVERGLKRAVPVYRRFRTTARL